MPQKKIELPENDGKGKYDYFSWGEFLFPVLPALKYSADGPDKNKLDRLFISDKNNRFRFYFESGYDALNIFLPDEADYSTIEIIHGKKNMYLRYPSQITNPRISTGYFRISFLNDAGIEKTCAGTLSIEPPQSYFDGLRKYDELYTLFTGLKAQKSKDGDTLT